MLSNTIKQLIARGKTDGLRDKVNVFYANGELTGKEYQELIEKLPKSSDNS